MVNMKEVAKFTKTLNILYAEDDENIRKQTVKLMDNFFKSITVAVDGKEAFDKYKAKSLEEDGGFDLIIADINMPNMTGIELLNEIRKTNTEIPCIVLSAYSDADYFMEAIKAGLDGYVVKPLIVKQFVEILDKVTSKLKLQHENIKYKEQLAYLNTDLEEQMIERISQIYALNKEIEDTQKEVVFTMGSIGESRSKETGNHVKRVAEYSKLMALTYGIKEEEAEMLKQASPMHDIGKVAIEDTILKKPGKLDFDEFKRMKEHAEIGYDMLKYSTRPLLKTAAIVAYQHHEKWDGTGYPVGLKGEDIHIYGRITALADVFDALGSNRIYKKAWDDEKIFNLFREERGKHFDPKLVDIFFEYIDQFLSIRDNLKEEL